MTNIPHDGAVGRVLELPEAIGWTNVEELLAGIVELTYETNRLIVYANTPKNRRPHIRDLKIPRPTPAAGQGEDVTPKKRPATSEEMAGFFGGAVRYVPELGTLERPGSGNGVPSAGGVQ